MEDLRRAAEESGLPTETRFISPASMKTLKMPFIAHLSPSDENSPLGHFLVVFDYRPETGDFGVIDGTSGNHSFRSVGVLSRSLSGYVLVPRDDVGRGLKLLFVVQLLVVISALTWRLAASMRTA